MRELRPVIHGTTVLVMTNIGSEKLFDVTTARSIRIAASGGVA